MSVEGQLGSDRVFAEDLPRAMRPHPGQAAAAANMRRVLAESPIVAGQWPDSLVQDAYSLVLPPGRGRGTRHRRACPHSCRPRIGQCRRQSRRHTRRTYRSPTATSTAPRSATCWTPSPSQSADLASISERRPNYGSSMSPAATASTRSWRTIPGVDSGRMIAQYTQAAIVSELERLAEPGERRLDPVVSDAGRPRRWSHRLHASCAGRSTD